MRIGTCAGILHLIVNWPWAPPLWDVCDDSCSTPGCGVDGKATVQEVHPFTHGVKPEPVPVDQRVARVETVTVVFDHEGRRRVGLGDSDDRRGSARVLAYVRQCLLDHPDHLDLTARRKGQVLVEVTV